MPRETKLQRQRRQAFERKVFVSVLKAAGNIVEEELRFDMRPKDSHARPKVPRLWRWDVALPFCLTSEKQHGIFVVKKIGIEIQGFGQGHQGTRDMKDDIEKNAEAFAQGWWVLYVTWAMIADGAALDTLARAGVRVTPQKGEEG